MFSRNNLVNTASHPESLYLDFHMFASLSTDVYFLVQAAVSLFFNVLMIYADPTKKIRKINGGSKFF